MHVKYYQVFSFYFSKYFSMFASKNSMINALKSTKTWTRTSGTFRNFGPELAITVSYGEFLGVELKLVTSQKVSRLTENFRNFAGIFPEFRRNRNVTTKIGHFHDGP